ncbi:MAG: ATP-binding cassette domain-containing protein [Phycisphaerales bacterium]
MPDPSVQPLLAADRVRKTYQLGRVRVPVLHGVHLAVDPGEWVAILGASGSGKSTLLHLCGGLDRPDKPRSKRPDRCARCRYDLAGLPAGAEVCPECGADVLLSKPARITFDGRDLVTMPQRDLDRFRSHDVGFVFQFYHLLPELTVVENVTVGAMVRTGRFGWYTERGEVAERARELLGAFGLDRRHAHRSAELSGGERQRVAIARALINRPRLLLADEPTGNLDRETGGAILDVIADLRERFGLTILMVTHDAEVAARADRVVTIADGVVVEPATPRAGP